jgi:hypothetical protein
MARTKNCARRKAPSLAPSTSAVRAISQAQPPIALGAISPEPQVYPKPRGQPKNRRFKYDAAVEMTVWLASVSISCILIIKAEAYQNGTWSESFLSTGRYDLAATSLPDHGLAIFSGGFGAGKFA